MPRYWNNAQGKVEPCEQPIILAFGKEEDAQMPSLNSYSYVE